MLGRIQTDFWDWIKVIKNGEYTIKYMLEEANNEDEDYLEKIVVAIL